MKRFAAQITFSGKKTYLMQQEMELFDAHTLIANCRQMQGVLAGRPRHVAPSTLAQVSF